MLKLYQIQDCEEGEENVKKCAKTHECLSRTQNNDREWKDCAKRRLVVVTNKEICHLKLVFKTFSSYCWYSL